MKRVNSLFLIVALALACSASSSAATLLSENFDELTTGLAVTSAGAFSAINGTNVDIVGPSNGYGPLCAAPESGNCIDLSGSGGNPQGVLQSTALMLAPGTNYYLSFDLIGSGRGTTDSTTVTFAGYNNTFTLTSGDVTNGIVSNALITVSSAGSYALTFTNNTPGNVGSVLDNVTITTAVTGTPEPASALLILPALFAGYAWKRRASRQS